MKTNNIFLIPLLLFPYRKRLTLNCLRNSRPVAQRKTLTEYVKDRAFLRFARSFFQGQVNGIDRKYCINEAGFGLLEVIVAVGIWVILASAGVMMTTGSLRINTQSTDNDQAVFLASEGLDAVRTIKKIGWTSPFLATPCVAGCGVATVSATWGFAGSSDLIGKYTRQLFVTPVNRDGSGNIVTTGGTVDPDTYKVESKVTWQRTPAITGTVSLVSYLTNYVKTIMMAMTGGLLIYGDGTTTPKYRTYDRTANIFSVENSGPLGSSGHSFQVRTSSKNSEAIAGYVTNTGELQIMCFDGTNWSNDWSVNVGGAATTRRFDIAYETNSGDVIVLYGTNASGTNELAYRTKPKNSSCGAASWSGVNNLDAAQTSGVIHWVKMAWDVRSSSDLIAAAWADENSDLSGAIWNGTSWSNEPVAVTETNLERIANSQDVDSFDLAYESLSGDLMLVWGTDTNSNNTNGVRYRVCNGGMANCTWGAVTTPPTFRDDSTNLDISSSSDSDEIVFASVGNQQNDLQIGYWNGSAWTNTANADTSCVSPESGSSMVATGWLISGATRRSIVRYVDQGSSRIDWYVGDTSNFAKQTDVNQTPAPKSSKYIDIQMDPVAKDQLMAVMSDGDNDLFAKKLVMTATPTFSWTNPDGTALTTTLPQFISSPFAFAYWRQ